MIHTQRKKKKHITRRKLAGCPFTDDRYSKTAPRHNIRYIVVHTTATKPDMPLSGLEKLPYHYVITKGGKLLSLRPVDAHDGTIEVALLGGLNFEGNHVDDRTSYQSETLFNTLVLLSERFPEARIKGADRLYVYPYPNPGFSVQGWLGEYLPSFLMAA